MTVLPLLKESLASVLIRPLLEDIPKDQFPNYKPDSVLFIDKELHADLIKAMISMPKIYPGDCVFWHGDLVHAVEPSHDHDGTKTNTVMYIPTQSIRERRSEKSGSAGGERRSSNLRK